MSSLGLIDASWRVGSNGQLRAYGRPPMGDPIPVANHGHAEISGVTGVALDAIVVTPPDPSPNGRNVDAGAVPPGSQTDPVPTTGTVRYVSPTGSDAANGLVGSPWRTVQFAINNTGVGATIVLRAGVYNEGGSPGTNELGVTFGTGHENTTLMAYPGEEVWFDGTTTLSGWTASTVKPGTSAWKALYNFDFDRSVQFARGSVDGTTTGYIWLNASDARGKYANYYDQLFTVNAAGQRIPMTLVGTAAELGPGKFWVEGTGSNGQVFNASTVHIGTDPASVSQVRASNKTTCLALVADGVTVKGFGVRGYAAGNCDGGVVKIRRTGGTVQDLTILDSSAVALDVYLNARPGPTTFRRVTVQRAGLNCVHGEKANGLKVYDSVFERANTHNWMMAPAAGGMKITSTVGVEVWRSKFNNNNADGFWCDASVYDCDVITCDAQSNNGHGFEYEISAKSRFVDCLSTSNGKSGVLIRCSDASEIWYCTSVGNAEVNIDITQDNRATATGPVAGVFGQDSRYSGKDDPIYGPSGMYWWIKNVTVRNCVAAKPNTAASGGALRIRTQSITRAIKDFGPQVDGNFYARPVSNSPATGWVLITTGYSTFAAYKSAATAGGVSMDPNGYNADGHDPLVSNYSLTTTDDAAAVAVVPGMNATIAALLGKTVGTKHVGAFL